MLVPVFQINHAHVLKTIACAVVGFVLLTGASAFAQNLSDGHGISDQIILKSGAVLRGQVVIAEDPDTGREHVTVRTPRGGTITLDDAKSVREVERPDPAQVQYQQRAAKIAAIEGHRAIIEWCLQQPRGRKKFESQIQLHARQIVQADPKDAKARKALGYEQDDDGVWILKEQFLAEHGYVPDGTSWRPVLGQAVENRKESRSGVVGDRKRSLSRWLRAAKRRDANAGELQQELFAFCDAAALDIIEKAAKKESSPAIRRLLIDGIGRVPTGGAARKLVRFAVQDPNAMIRERALTLLGQEHYDKQQASKWLTEFFGSKNNADIQRAAFAIGELDGYGAIPDLIEVLVTVHVQKNPNALEPGRLNPTFNRNGDAGLQTGGGGGPQHIVRTIQNDSVLTALKSLTNENLGFDIERWRQWHIESTTHYNVNVRAD